MAGKVTAKRLGGMDMTEYKIGRAIVRMHGTPKREIIEPAAARFLTVVEQKKRRLATEGGERNDRNQTNMCGVRQSHQR